MAQLKKVIQIQEIINLAEKKYKKEFEEINTLHFDIYGEHTNPIPRMFGIMPIGLSFFESQFATDESYMEWMIFLSKSNYIAGENIIDLTLALSEIFNRNMTKEEAEKLQQEIEVLEKENEELQKEITAFSDKNKDTQKYIDDYWFVLVRLLFLIVVKPSIYQYWSA